MGGSPARGAPAPADVPPCFADGRDPAARGTGPRAEPGARHRPVTGSAGLQRRRGRRARRWTADPRQQQVVLERPRPRFLQVDLGSAQTVSAFVVKHAGLGGEHTGWNTAAFTIATSTDGTTFSPAVSVTGARNSRTYHPIPARTRAICAVRPTSTPANDGNAAARIYELEVYGVGGAAGRPGAATARPPRTRPAAPTRGRTRPSTAACSGGWSDKWCSQGASQVAAGRPRHPAARRLGGGPARRRGRRVRRPGTPATSTCRPPTTATSLDDRSPRSAATPPTRPPTR